MKTILVRGDLWDVPDDEAEAFMKERKGAEAIDLPLTEHHKKIDGVWKLDAAGREAVARDELRLTRGQLLTMADRAINKAMDEDAPTDHLRRYRRDLRAMFDDPQKTLLPVKPDDVEDIPQPPVLPYE